MFLPRAASEVVVGVCVECGLPVDGPAHACPVPCVPTARDLRALHDDAVAAQKLAEGLWVTFRAAVVAERLEGRTLRDIGAEAGVSPQRIHELTACCRR